MDNPAPTVEDELAALTRTLDRALERLRRLAEENASLRRGRDQLAGERAALLTRNEQARARVEAMIERLKALESAG
jgi:cell division protein ZapB